MVHLPYSQPFEDGNKRVSRPGRQYSTHSGRPLPAVIRRRARTRVHRRNARVYEMTRMELLRDVFVWAYERSCQRYVVVRDSIAEPDRFRMRYRQALTDTVSRIVREKEAAH